MAAALSPLVLAWHGRKAHSLIDNGRVWRLLAVLPVGALLFLPVAPAATPSPSPDLDTVLAKAPASFNEVTTGIFSGRFDANRYATTASSSKAKEIQATLEHDGFVAGFGKQWVQRGVVSHGLVELVLAFNGNKGAKIWLAQSESADKTSASYKHPDSISGIDPYYGAHFVYSSNGTFSDGFAFVKGNDFFLVVAASPNDDVLNLAVDQAKEQYTSAPASTIPQSEWPENSNASDKLAYDLGSAFGALLLLIPVVGVILVAVLLILRSRRKTVTSPFVAPVATEMSPDGNFWWDGQVWRDASREVPPTAQRSSDGTLWWDNRNWRPIPKAQPPS
jgi:hypothetical protein